MHGTVNVFVAAVSIVVPFPTVGGDGSGRRHLAAYLSTGNHEADTLLESLDEGLSLPLLKVVSVYAGVLKLSALCMSERSLDGLSSV